MVNCHLKTNCDLPNADENIAIIRELIMEDRRKTTEELFDWCVLDFLPTEFDLQMKTVTIKLVLYNNTKS